MKNFHIFLFVLLCLGIHGPQGSFGWAADEEQEFYVNWWPINDVNRRNWQKGKEVGVKNLGTTEISRFAPTTPPTPEQIKAADELIVQTTAAALRHNWFDFNQAVKAGYRYHDSVHYSNLEYINDGRVLDPDKPENLMYYRNEKGEMKLVAAMYLMREIGEHGPQVGGPLTPWHYHTSPVPICWFDFPTTPNPRLVGPCDIGERNQRSPEMLHVWFIDHPEGVFSSTMAIPWDTRESYQCMTAAPVE